MGEIKKFVADLPNSLLEEGDFITSMDNQERNQLIKKLMALHIEEKKQSKVYQVLRDGYLEMSDINLALSEEGFEQDVAELHIYETRLTGWGKM